MTNAQLEKLKFPIGEFKTPKSITSAQLNNWISDIAQFPKKVKNLTSDLSKQEMNYRYRPNGWTIKQVVHHCADSHMNSLIRFKLALTEDLPTIRPYHEDKWAELTDSLDNDVKDSLRLLKGLHRKWANLLRDLSPEQLKRQFIHPATGKKYSLDENIGVYAWHCNHHLAHIELAIESGGKYND